MLLAWEDSNLFQCAASLWKLHGRNLQGWLLAGCLPGLRLSHRCLHFSSQAGCHFRVRNTHVVPSQEATFSLGWSRRRPGRPGQGSILLWLPAVCAAAVKLALNSGSGPVHGRSLFRGRVCRRLAKAASAVPALPGMPAAKDELQWGALQAPF